MKLQEHFEQVRQLIHRGQTTALQAAYTEQLKVYWQVGAYVYHRLQSATWGEQVVNQLADWLKRKEPTLKQFDRRALYRMREFYQTWHALDWDTLKRDGSIIELPIKFESESIDKQYDEFVVTLSPQFKLFHNMLSSLSWSHHLDILGKTRNLEEKVFYLLLGIKEKYTVRELRRQIETGLYERQRSTRLQIAGNQHPNAKIIPSIFKDKYIFEFLDLPEPYSENDLKKGLISRLKDFILEILCKGLHKSSYAHKFVM